ncbi:uncharacterized protein METZ01_LOCUS202679, partial [marine metagenome]
MGFTLGLRFLFATNSPLAVVNVAVVLAREGFDSASVADVNRCFSFGRRFASDALLLEPTLPTLLFVRSAPSTLFRDIDLTANPCSGDTFALVGPTFVPPLLSILLPPILRLPVLVLKALPVHRCCRHVVMLATEFLEVPRIREERLGKSPLPDLILADDMVPIGRWVS